MLHESVQISKKKKALALEGIINFFHANEITYAQATNFRIHRPPYKSLSHDG